MVDNSFEMRILNLFHFRDGRTIFAGLVYGRDQFIKRCKAEIRFQNERYQTITIEGEWLSHPRNSEGYRAVSTFDQITLTRELVQERQYILQMFSPEN